MDEENWVESDSEEESEDPNQLEELLENPATPTPSAIPIAIDDDEERNVNVDELELQNDSPALHAYFIENRNHLENHLEILNRLRQLQISESSILDIIKSGFPRNILNEIVEKLNK